MGLEIPGSKTNTTHQSPRMDDVAPPTRLTNPWGNRFARGANDARVDKLTNLLRESIDAQGRGDVYRVQALSGNESLRMKVVMVSQTHQDASKRITTICQPIFVQTETDGTRTDTYPKKLADGTVIDQPVLPIFLIGRRARTELNTAIATATPNSAIRRVLPPIILTLETELDNPQVIGGILFNIADRMAHDASTTGYIAEVENYVKDLGSKYITLKTEFNPQPLTNVFGLPVRSDIAVNATASRGARNDLNSLHAVTEQVVRTDAYIDLMEVTGLSPYRRDVLAQQPYAQFFSNLHYRPVVNLTNIQPASSDSNYLEAFILGIANATVMSDHSLAILTRYFRNNGSRSLPNTRNLGAIGLTIPDVIESKDGDLPVGIVDTSTDEWRTNPEAMLHLVNSNLDKSPIFALHLEEAGELSYLYNDFLTMIVPVSGDESGELRKRGEEARNRIIAAADRLTNNEFSKNFPANAPIVEASGYVLHNGYTIGADGEREDIRKYQDTLALLNTIGTTSIDSVYDYLNALYDTNADIDLRASRTRDLLKTILGSNITFTSLTNVVFLTDKFLNALRQSIPNALNISFEFHAADVGDSRTRSYTNINRIGRLEGNYVAPIGAPAGGYGHHQRPRW